MKTVFLTGVTGQCGSFLAEQLLEKGYRVVGLRRRTSTFNTERVEHIYLHPDFVMEWGNITDSSNLYRLLVKYNPDIIINAAAQSHVKVSFEVSEETFDVTAGGVLKLLNAYKDVCPNAKFFQFSSSEMYGDNPEFPQNEETRMTPASPYACAKLAGHNLCRNYRESYGLKIYCGIIFNNESERRGETFVTRKITRAAARIKLGLQNNLELGNLDAKRDWGYTPDYMKCIIRLLESNLPPDDFVISTGETHTVREFLEETFKIAGISLDHVSINEKFFRPHEVPVLLGDSTKIKNALGWEPEIKFKNLVKVMYDHDLQEQIKQNNIDYGNLPEKNNP